MDVEIKVTITAPDGTTQTDTIGKLTKGFETIGEIGLSIDESKTLFLNIQKKIVDAQCAAFCAERVLCQCCGRKLRCKAHRQIRYRTVFGDVGVNSPRFYHCQCHDGPAKTFTL